MRSDRMNARGLPVGSSSEDDLKRPKSATMVATIRDAAMFRTTPPFILSHDVVRGIAFAGHSALQFAFMLVVMYVLRPLQLRWC